MKQPLPESYLNLLADADALVAWQPSINVFEDISNLCWQPTTSQAACQLKDSAHQPGASVVGVRAFPAAFCGSPHKVPSCKSHVPATNAHWQQQQTQPHLQQQQTVKQQQKGGQQQQAIVQPSLLPSPLHHQHQQSHTSNPTPPLKRPAGHSSAALASGWRSVKRRSCSPSKHQPTPLQQLRQQPAASTATMPACKSHQNGTLVGATDHGGTAVVTAAAAEPALVAADAAAPGIELCLPDSQAEPGYHTLKFQRHHAAAVAPQAAAGPKTDWGGHRSSAAGLMPYLDYIPATEVDAAGVTAGPMPFRDYIPATQHPTAAVQLAELGNGSVGGVRSIDAVKLAVRELAATSTSAAAAATAGSPAGASVNPRSCAAVLETSALAAESQQQPASGLVLFEDYVPATVLPETQLHQLEAAHPGQLDMVQQLLAPAAAVVHQAAGQNAAAGGAVAAGDTGGGNAYSRTLSTGNSLSSCGPAGSCGRTVTSSSVISSDDGDDDQQQQRHSVGQQQCRVEQQHLCNNTLWQDLGETQPQPLAASSPLAYYQPQQRQQTLLGVLGTQQQVLQRWQSAAGLAGVDVGETQPQPGVHGRQQQQQLDKCKQPGVPQQQLGCVDLDETQPQPQPDVVERQSQEQRQQQQLLDECKLPAAPQQQPSFVDVNELRPGATAQWQQRRQVDEGVQQHHHHQQQQLAMQQRMVQQSTTESARAEQQQQRHVMRQHTPVQARAEQQQQQVQPAGVCRHLRTSEQQHGRRDQGTAGNPHNQQQSSISEAAAAVCPDMTIRPVVEVMQDTAAVATPSPAAGTGLGAGADLATEPKAVPAPEARHTASWARAGPPTQARSTDQTLPAGREHVKDAPAAWVPILSGAHSKKASVAANPVGAFNGRSRGTVDHGCGRTAVSSGWHTPARQRKWNTAPKPGSIMSLWSKAGVVNNKQR